MPSTQNVAIIGAGLSGLTLALTLYKQSIRCTIYEARPAPLDIGGAIMLSPNALRILDILGVYERIRPHGYDFDELHFRSASNELVDVYEFGNAEKYGYRGMRIYRHILISKLSALAEESNIPIQYNRKFSHVVSETPTDVTWQFADGATTKATCLVGADGIHSRVRKYLYPELEPKSTNMMGVTAAVPTASLKVPDGYQLPVTIMSPRHGAFVIAPQQQDGSEVLIGRQKRAPELDRAGWTALMNDTNWCVDFLRGAAEDFPEIVRNAVSDISPHKINLWPFYVVPRLEKWNSEHSRVVIMGDAAHAIAPTSGQGVNQAFEDVYTYSLILGKAGESQLDRALQAWRRGRQERVDKVLELNAKIDKRRMPKQEDQDTVEMGENYDLEWLYGPDFEAMVEGWLRKEGLEWILSDI